MEDKVRFLLESLSLIDQNAVERKENIELAIAAFRASSELYTRRAFPVEWAKTQMNLGIAYYNRNAGERKENIELAIAACRASLEVYTHQAFPFDWAKCQYNLGVAYYNRIAGECKENIELAIAAYCASLEVYTRRAFPFEWARSQYNLGAAYCDRIAGERKENIELTISAYCTSLEVLTRQAFPFEWAKGQNNLSIAYHNRVIGDYKENIELAIAFCHASLEVLTRQTFPFYWAKGQNNLGIAYSNRIAGERKENIELAIAAFRASLEVHTRQTSPFEWAKSQMNLGSAYLARLVGVGEENIELAIAAYCASLEVYTRHAFPFEWATYQNNLGLAYLERIAGEREENIELAIAAFRASLEVLTCQTFPDNWATSQTNLGIAYSNRIAGERKENIKLAIQAYRTALEVNQSELHPRTCIRTGYNLGDLAFKEGDWPLAIEGFEKVITAVETSRTWAINESRRQEILNEVVGYGIYEKMLQSCINGDRLDLALQTVERVRSKRLVDLMAAPDLYPQGEVPEPVQLILDRLAHTQQQMDNLRMSALENTPELTGAGTRDRAAVKPKNKEIQALEAQKQDLIDDLSRYDAVSAQLVEISPQDISQIQTELLDRPDVALLSFYTTIQDTYILIVRLDSIQCFTCSGQGIEQLQYWLVDEWVISYLPPSIKENSTPEELAVWEKEYRDKKVQWQQKMPERLQQLAEKLELDRLVAEHLQNACELILIPHLLLHLISFAALPLNGHQHYLGDRFLLRYAPSCQVLKFCTERKELPSQQQYGTVENTTEDLPLSEFEGEAIAQIFQIEEINRLRGSKQATLEKYRELLNRVNSVVSCHHAQSRLDNPLESALILAEGRRITLADLLSPAWRFADLGDVFLSCCETGMTMPRFVTDELLTLGTGFLCAGARSVISTLWSIDDLATAIFSILYHQNRHETHGNMNRPQALQQAQQTLREMTGSTLNQTYRPKLEAMLNVKLDEADNNRRQAATEHERKYWAKVAIRIGDTLDRIENLCDQPYPFEHPIYWVGFVCHGQR